MGTSVSPWVGDKKFTDDEMQDPKTSQVDPNRHPQVRPVTCCRHVLLLLRMRQPCFTKPDRRSQFGQPSFARHLRWTQETTVYDGHFRRNQLSQFGKPSLADLPLDGVNHFSSGSFFKQEDHVTHTHFEPCLLRQLTFDNVAGNIYQAPPTGG